MPEGPDGKTIIIVKKVSGHGGHHGGAWKVAFADFVTAMMALFMVLWLVNSAAEPTRDRIASYFKKPGIFQKGSGNPMEMGGGGILPDAFSPPTDGNAQIQVSDRLYTIDAATGRVRELYDEGQGSKENRYAPKISGEDAHGTTEEENFQVKEDMRQSSAIEQKKIEELRTEIEKIIEETSASSGDGEAGLESDLGDVEIKVDQRGLVIEIMDTEKTSMFQSGQAGIMPEASSKLTEIAKVLSKVPNPIDLEGHTDAAPFRSGRDYDNWNLSSDRAHAARRVMEAAGFEKGKIARVVGYADERPRDTANPLNPANRRITISMRYTDRAKQALEGTQTIETSASKKPKVTEESTKPAPAPSPVEIPAAKVKTGDGFTVAPTLENLSLPQKSGVAVEISTTTPEKTEPDARRSTGKKDLIFDSPSAFFKK